MWIIDLTDQLSKNQFNYYCFNPSLVHYRDDIYIMVYRVVKYDVPASYHPWKIWDNGYKFFKNPEQVMQLKYRNHLGDSHSVKINHENKIHKISEFDSTGLAFFSFDGSKFNLLVNVNNIFGQEMNQDARIFFNNDKFYVSYNVFEKYNGKTHVVMRYRELYISLPQTNLIHEGDNYVKLSKEYKMITEKYQQYDKNCVFDSKMNVLYNLNGKFGVIIDGKLVNIAVPEIERLIQYYGKDNVYVSIGTSPIPYQGKYLAAGHIKICYKNLTNKNPVNHFLQSIDFNNIYKHGKYIYFMFLYLFDDNYKIVKLSNPFIPTYNMNHLPYLLAFPSGLCRVDGKITISYGEGDCRCKLLVLNDCEVDRLLVDKLDMGFYFLVNNYYVQHYGYFGHYNTGDDAFMEVFDYLHKKYYPHAHIVYNDKYEQNHDLTIVGGGDVINEYFINEKLADDQSLIAVGVGIPYMSQEHLIKKFKYTILRNPRDQKLLKNKYPNIFYYPDLAFLLPRIFGVSQPKVIDPQTTPCNKKIGMCLIRTYYHRDYPHLYENFVKEIIIFVANMLENNNSIHLIPFCINKLSIKENDLLLLNDIKKHFPTNDRVIIEYDESYTKETYVRKIYQKVGEMDFNICSRFHSHIFSTIHQIPFVSLTCGRKCLEYMRDIELSHNVYQLNTNEIDLPVGFDGNKFFEFVVDKMRNSYNIRIKLNYFMQRYDGMMDEFESYWKKVVYNNLAQSRKNVRLYPSISRSNNIFDCPNSPPPLSSPPVTNTTSSTNNNTNNSKTNI